MQSIFSKLFIASDHAGFKLKEELRQVLLKKSIQIDDLGCFSEESVDYPVYARKMAQAIAGKKNAGGILLCGTGIGMSIMVNRFSYIRGTLCTSVKNAEIARKHNDSNVLILAGRQTDIQTTEEMTETWLTTTFAGGRHARRIAMLQEI